MKALVVYETEFGNTAKVAGQVAEGLGKVLETTLLPVAKAPAAIDPAVALVVVGGPTHAFAMSRESTRRDAESQGGRDPGTGIREWLGHVAVQDAPRFALFDTRVDKVRRLPGSAAHSAARLVRRRRLGKVLSVESFYVGDVAGPLLGGETERAFSWGLRVGSELLVSEATRR